MATIKSKYGWKSTADQTIGDVDLTGKIAIVTGSSAGIGVDTVRVFATHGAKVIMAVRDTSKAQPIKDEIQKLPGVKEEIVIMGLNLASFRSVRTFAEEFKKLNLPLNILVNNAGVMVPPYTKTEDGNELQFQTNHLSHFLLTNLLINELEKGAPSRVVNVSSLAHSFSDIKWDDYNFENKYAAWSAYGQSKTANILFSVELTKRFQHKGIYSNALHPGSVHTGLSKHSILSYFSALTYYAGFLKSPAQGAATSVFVATSPSLEKIGGKYFSDSNEAKPSAYSTNHQAAERLWEISEKIVHLQ